MQNEAANGEAAVQLSVEEQLAANQEEAAKLIAAQNGADTRVGGDADAAAQYGANACNISGGNAQAAHEHWDKDSLLAGSVVDLLAPLLHKVRASSFGKPDPNSKYPGLCKMWDSALTCDPAKAAKIFNPGKAAKLANFEVIGHSLLDIQGGICDYINLVPPDNEAVGLMLELNDDLDLLLDTVKKNINEYTLRWHHPTRLAVISQFTGDYERDMLGGPACML